MTVNEVDFFTINNITGEVSLGRELDGSWAAGGGTFVPLVIQVRETVRTLCGREGRRAGGCRVRERARLYTQVLARVGPSTLWCCV